MERLYLQLYYWHILLFNLSFQNCYPSPPFLWIWHTIALGLHIGYRRKLMETQAGLSVFLVAKVAVAMVNVKHMLVMVS